MKKINDLENIATLSKGFTPKSFKASARQKTLSLNCSTDILSYCELYKKFKNVLFS